MDFPVLCFRKTGSGARFAEAWKAVRIIRDLGSSSPAEPAAPAA